MNRVASRRAGFVRGAATILLLTTPPLRAHASEVIPPAPLNHFHDYAGAVSPDESARLNETLARFEDETSHRLIMLVYPRMQSDSYVGDYVDRITRAWNLAANSAVLFVFLDDRKAFLAAGAGLQSAFRDEISIDLAGRVMGSSLNDLKYAKALSLGAEAMILAVRDEESRCSPWWSLLLLLPLGAFAWWRWHKVT